MFLSTLNTHEIPMSLIAVGGRNSMPGGTDAYIFESSTFIQPATEEEGSMLPYPNFPHDPGWGFDVSCASFSNPALVSPVVLLQYIYEARMYSYLGICPDARESLILFEAVKRGIIPTVSDRLSEEERKEIVSGAIYIWDERKSPMRRWTDGRTWSNSRVVGDFLEYRESVPDLTSKSGKYSIKPYGLRKRTICSPSEDSSSLRLIAYFTSSDVKSGNLKLPSEDPRFADIVRDFDENPTNNSCLNLLAYTRKRKRFKSSLEQGPENENQKVEESTSPSHREDLDSVNAGASAVPKESQAPSLADSQASQRDKKQTEDTRGQNDKSPDSVSSSPSPGRSKLNSDVPHLPSPVWCPQNMHSEDRRALNLLDSHDIVVKDSLN